MAHPLGHNPMRWKCKESGCFNVKARPKIEELAGCIPGRGAFTDVDATCELGGHFLFLEFKYKSRYISDGQRIYYQQLTGLSKKVIAVVVCCDSETMEVSACRVVRNGEFGVWEPCTFSELKGRIKAWADKAYQRRFRFRVVK